MNRSEDKGYLDYTLLAPCSSSILVSDENKTVAIKLFGDYFDRKLRGFVIVAWLPALLYQIACFPLGLLTLIGKLNSTYAVLTIPGIVFPLLLLLRSHTAVIVALLKRWEPTFLLFYSLVFCICISFVVAGDLRIVFVWTVIFPALICSTFADASAVRLDQAFLNGQLSIIVLTLPPYIVSLAYLFSIIVLMNVSNTSDMGSTVVYLSSDLVNSSINFSYISTSTGITMCIFLIKSILFLFINPSRCVSLYGVMTFDIVTLDRIVIKKNGNKRFSFLNKKKISGDTFLINNVDSDRNNTNNGSNSGNNYNIKGNNILLDHQSKSSNSRRIHSLESTNNQSNNNINNRLYNTLKNVVGRLGETMANLFSFRIGSKRKIGIEEQINTSNSFLISEKDKNYIMNSPKSNENSSNNDGSGNNNNNENVIGNNNNPEIICLEKKDNNNDDIENISNSTINNNFKTNGKKSFISSNSEKNPIIDDLHIHVLELAFTFTDMKVVTPISRKVKPLKHNKKKKEKILNKFMLGNVPYEVIKKRNLGILNSISENKSNKNENNYDIENDNNDMIYNLNIKHDENKNDNENIQNDDELKIQHTTQNTIHNKSQIELANKSSFTVKNRNEFSATNRSSLERDIEDVQFDNNNSNYTTNNNALCNSLNNNDDNYDNNNNDNNNANNSNNDSIINTIIIDKNKNLENYDDYINNMKTKNDPKNGSKNNFIMGFISNDSDELNYGNRIGFNHVNSYNELNSTSMDTLNEISNLKSNSSDYIRKAKYINSRKSDFMLNDNSKNNTIKIGNNNTNIKKNNSSNDSFDSNDPRLSQRQKIIKTIDHSYNNNTLSARQLRLYPFYKAAKAKLFAANEFSVISPIPSSILISDENKTIGLLLFGIKFDRYLRLFVRTFWFPCFFSQLCCIPVGILQMINILPKISSFFTIPGSVFPIMVLLQCHKKVFQALLYNFESLFLVFFTSIFCICLSFLVKFNGLVIYIWFAIFPSLILSVFSDSSAIRLDSSFLKNNSKKQYQLTLCYALPYYFLSLIYIYSAIIILNLHAPLSQDFYKVVTINTGIIDTTINFSVTASSSGITISLFLLKFIYVMIFDYKACVSLKCPMTVNIAVVEDPSTDSEGNKLEGHYVFESKFSIKNDGLNNVINTKDNGNSNNEDYDQNNDTKNSVKLAFRINKIKKFVPVSNEIIENRSI